MRNNDNDGSGARSAVLTEEAPGSEARQELLKAPDKTTTKVSRARRILHDHPWPILAILLVVIVGATYFIRGAFLYEGTDDAQVDGHIMPLSARINGQVLEVRVIEGQLVRAGDVLVTIDPQDYRIAAEQAEANLADAKASAASSHWNVPITSITVKSNLDSAKTAVLNAEAGLKAAEQNYDSAKAALEEAEANSIKSDADLVRYKQLVAKEDISRQQYDQAVATATANQAVVRSARAGVLAAQHSVEQAQGKLFQARDDLQSAQTAPQQISVIRAKAEAADAQVLQRKAQFNQAELNLGYTVIRSPVTGIIGKKTVEVGQNVGIGQELVEVVPQVVGFAETPTPDPNNPPFQIVHAFLWQGGVMTDLGTLGGPNSGANGINDAGQVVGGSDTSSSTTHAFLWEKGVMTDLGTLPGDVSSFATDIGNKGQVVGLSCDASGNCSGFLWQNGAMSDLNSLIPADSTLHLFTAFQINSRGQIVGTAVEKNTGQFRAYLATPTRGGAASESAALALQGESLRIALPENVRKLLQQRLGFGRFRLGLTRPQ